MPQRGTDNEAAGDSSSACTRVAASWLAAFVEDVSDLVAFAFLDGCAFEGADMDEIDEERGAAAAAVPVIAVTQRQRVEGSRARRRLAERADSYRLSATLQEWELDFKRRDSTLERLFPPLVPTDWLPSSD